MKTPAFTQLPLTTMNAYTLPVLLLLGSNLFMTFAWYGHLKYRTAPLALAIAASWGIALFEYCLMVPANRIGSTVYSAPQLKGMQEIITLLVFAGFSTWYLDQPLKWNHWAGFALVVVAAWLIFLD
ncbi:DMT family protein [Lysobacter humi (ex Lee et al. 2017)]